MTPIRFPEENSELAPPRGLEGDVAPLPVHRVREGRVISCWRLGWRERLSVLLFGRVWLDVWSMTHPPLALTACRSYFKPERPRAHWGERDEGRVVLEFQSATGLEKIGLRVRDLMRRRRVVIKGRNIAQGRE